MFETTFVCETFKKITDLKEIHEAVYLMENKAGSMRAADGYGGKTLDTPMVMASITKLFTTTAVLILIERGQLHLTDKVSQFFSDDIMDGLHVFEGKEYSQELEVYDLLFQCSGLTDFLMEGGGLSRLAENEDFYYSFDELIAMSKSLKPHFAPRKAAFYTNINFDILGKIIESVTGLSIAEVFQDFIIDPLGLSRTYIVQSEEDFVPAMYLKNKKIERPNAIRTFGASGGGITTARELMVFLKAFFSEKFFKQESFDQLRDYRKLQPSMRPVRYGGGHMKITPRGISTFFIGKGSLLGHVGTSGSFAFYHPENDLFLVGDLNQLQIKTPSHRLISRMALSRRK